MEKDYQPSQKYTEEDLESLNIPYALRDACVDHLADHRKCEKKARFGFLPFYHKWGECKQFYDGWIACQSNREFDIREQKLKALGLDDMIDLGADIDIENKEKGPH